MSTTNPENIDDSDNLKDIENVLEEKIRHYNLQALSLFDGLSPMQMSQLQNNFFKGDSEGPLILNNVSEEHLKQSPLLMQVRFLMEKMKDEKVLKLTKNGVAFYYYSQRTLCFRPSKELFYRKRNK